MKNGNFKVRCINLNGCNANNYTVGKVYEVKDGQLTTDNGFKFPTERKIGSFEDWEAFSSSEFELVNSNTTVIYHKDRETIAMLKDGNKVIKTAKAICNPKDEFSPDYGEKLAFARLHGLDEKVMNILLNGIEEVVAKTDGNFKVRCVDTHGQDHIYTKGKVYEIVDGIFTWDTGETSDKFFTRYEKFKDIEHLNNRFMAKFEPVGNELVPQSFDWEGFKAGKFAVHCDTEEKAKQFFDELKMQGIKWCSGVELNETNRWNEYKQETCYTAPDDGLEFSSERFYRREGFQIISYSPNYREVKRTAKVGEWIKVINANFIPTTNGKDDYKNGDVLKVLNTEGFSNKPRYAEGTGNNGNSRILNHDEYIVLELITHTTEEPKSIDLSTIPTDTLFEELRKRVK